MFQPARPWLMKSSVARRRATSHGKLYVVDTVAIRPTCSVAVATADSSGMGSNPWPGRYSDRNSATPGLSGRKIESMMPRSAIRASSM